jgi:oligosaccharide repeat unit polymerase
MLETFSSPWLPCLILVGLALIARQARGSWLSPGPLVALVWAVYVSACLLLTDYTVYASGIWVVVLFVFSVQFGTVLSEGLDSRSGHSRQDRTIGRETSGTWENRSLRFSLLFAIVALVGCVHLVFVSLEKFSLDFSLLDMLSLGHLWSVARYERGELEPWSVRLLIMWVYPAVLLAGISFALARNRMQKWLAVVPLVPAALIGTVFAARAGLLISLICWFSGFFAIRYRQTGGTYALFQRKFVLLLLMLMMSGLLFFLTIDAVRVFKGGGFEIGSDVPRLSKYFLGSVPAFSNWAHTSKDHELSMGAYTFAGVFDLLGMKPRQIGVYEELQTLAGGEETNIYTLLRGLIQDFTLPGASLFGVLIGIVAGSAARSESMKRLRDVLILAGYYAFIIFSPLSSLFTYNGLILAWSVAALVLGLRTRQRAPEARMVPASV